MHVNFLHPFFKSRVDCDVVSSDGYSVANLVSLDFRERSRGFLAAHFIKPPALLLFQLPFPVHVESMIIKPKVGSQISSGIAILVAGIATKGNPTRKGDSSNSKSTQFSKRKRTKKELLSNPNKVGFSQNGSAVYCQNPLEKETSIPNHSYELDVTPASVKGEHSQFFTQVAWLNDREGKTVHIQNKLFEERSPIQGLHPVGRPDFQQEEFQRLYSLQKVTHVALKIARLSGSSVPAIGKVEIWGQPSAGCKPGVLEYALGIQQNIQAGEIKKTAAIGDQYNRTTEDSKHHALLKCSSSSIPEDFIDPITCEIMTVPLLLPSGHNIDTATLEKHITAERSWGRLPSDPFTGKVFSDTSKPVPNSALKVRIDKFLLTSGISTAGYGRIVGRENNLTRASNPNNSHLLETNSKASAEESNKSVCHDSKEFSQQSVSNSIVPTSEQSELAHEEAVSKSLDSAVHQTLKGLHMFTRNRTNSQEKPLLTQSSITQTNSGFKGRVKRQAPQASEMLRNHIKKKSTVWCVSCDRDLSAESIFHLPCQHVICRSCLINATRQKISESTCKLCKTKFRQVDVTRVHNI